MGETPYNSIPHSFVGPRSKTIPDLDENTTLDSRNDSLQRSGRAIYPLETQEKPGKKRTRAVALSGTGNGDSFLRLAAARTAGAMVRYGSTTFLNGPTEAVILRRSLASAVHQVAGPGGELQRSAGSWWGHTGEGEGGMIGIDFWDQKGQVVFDFNCGGMLRCWVDEEGKEWAMVFKDDY